jgi:AcrR family transcriptional regulator
VTEFQRARSAEAKQLREEAILEAAARLAARSGIREVTLTGIAHEVGMHKSAMLRYFETREQIFLRLTAAGWRDWSASLRSLLREMSPGVPAATVARAFADTLTERPVFCDLLAQAPLNLERNVSLESVRTFKLATLEEVEAIGAELTRLSGLGEQERIDVIATATSLAGALWQMATPGPLVEELYRSDPRLAHAIVEIGPRLTRVLTAQLTGLIHIPLQIAFVDVHQRTVAARPVREAEALVQAAGGEVRLVDADVHRVRAPVTGLAKGRLHEGPPQPLPPPGRGDVQFGQVALQAGAPDRPAEAEHCQAIRPGSGEQDERVAGVEELPDPFRQRIGWRGRLVEFPVKGVEQLPDGGSVIAVRKANVGCHESS